MIFNEENEEFKTINTFPPPFKNEYTPYNVTDFNDKTKKLCRNSHLFKTEKVFKIIVVGDMSVGKTCIVSRFCHRAFNSNYKATIGVDFEVEIFTILGVSFTLQIWDTAGQERFKCIAQSYYRGAHAVMVVFDMADLLSLSHCEIWLRESLEVGNINDPLIFLVGNKCDLLSPAAYKNLEDLGAVIAQKLGAEYWSVSAKTGKNVKKMFLRMAALIFNASMEKENLAESNGNATNIGTSLVSFKKNAKNKKQTSNCNNCSK